MMHPCWVAGAGAPPEFKLHQLPPAPLAPPPPLQELRDALEAARREAASLQARLEGEQKALQEARGELDRQQVRVGWGSGRCSGVAPCDWAA